MQKKYLYLIHILLFLRLFLFSYSLFADQNNPEIVDLEFCIKQAIESHPKLQMTSFGIDKKKEKLNIVKAKYLPKLDTNAGYKRLDLPNPKLSSANDNYSIGFAVSQPLFKTNENFSEEKFVKFGIGAIEQEYALAKKEIIFNVKAAYFKLLFAYDVLEIKNEYFNHTKSFYDTAVDLNRRTKMPREETLLRLSVQMGEIKQEIVAAENNIEISGKILVNAMGLDSSSQGIKIKKLKDSSIFLDDKALSLALSPEILKIDSEIKAAEEAINLSKRSLYPQVKAYYNQGYEWSDFSSRNSDWTLGISADFNVWDWGKTKSEIKQAEIKKSEIETYRNLVNRQLTLELESARLEYEAACKKYELALKALQQARASLDLFEKRYLSGLVTSLELLDSQKTLNQAQMNVANSKFEISIAIAKIEFVAVSS